MKAKRNQIAERSGWVTVPVAARRLNIARPTVLQRALLGDLKWKTFAGDVYIATASLEEQEQVA